jgi:hypothetical protein
MPKQATPAKPANADEQHGDKKSRVQLATVLSINISQARCATHLKQNLGDETIEGEIKELRKALKTSKASGEAGEQTALKAQIAEKAKALVRISSETPIASAVIWDSAVKELLRHGMDQAIASDRKIVDASHIHDGTPESLVHYPLYSKCEIWRSYDPEHEEELKKGRAASNKVAKEVREAKKASEEKGGRKGKAAAPAPAPAPAGVPPAPEEEDDDGEASKTTFCTYVENALKTVKKDDPYKSMRVSNRVREYLSELVAQGLARQALLARIIVQRVMGVRTMNTDHVKAVVHMLMADEGRTPEQIEAVTSSIDEKLGVYHDHLQSEKEKKAAALDDDKKQDNEKKKREAELGRKKKQIEQAKRRAVEAAQKAKELTAETAALSAL